MRSSARAFLSRDRHQGTGNFLSRGVLASRETAPVGQKDFSLPRSFLKGRAALRLSGTAGETPGSSPGRLSRSFPGEVPRDERISVPERTSCG